MRRPRFEIYRDKIGDHRWRLRAVNGRIVAESGEGYRKRHAARDAVARLFELIDYMPGRVEEHIDDAD